MSKLRLKKFKDPISKDKRKAILKRYVSLGDPLLFAGRSKLSKYLQLNDARINKDILAKNYSYGLHRYVRRPKNFNPFFVNKPREQIQCDLIDVRNLNSDNDNVNYLLVCIDTFSRRAWVNTMKSKTKENSVLALKKVLDEMYPLLPKSILFDRGAEFKNSLISSFLEKKDIKIDFPNTKRKASIAERFNQTLQYYIYTGIDEFKTKKYIDKLQLYVESYNNRVHSSLFGFSPMQAERTENYLILAEKFRDKYQHLVNKGIKKLEGYNRFEIGDIVRIINDRFVFKRSYDKNFSNELYKIIEIKTNMPIPMYKVQTINSKNKEILKGSFYSEELQLVRR